MPGVFMSTMKQEMPSCFGLSGSVRARQMPQCASFARRRPHLLAVEQPAAVDARRARRQRREVGAGARLAEQLAPDDLAAQRRQDPPVLLLARAVHDQVRQRPRADHDPRADDLGGTELLLDHEQFERAGVATPRARPRRRDVAGVDESRTVVRAAGSVLDLGEERPQLGAHRLGLGGQVGAERSGGRRPSRHGPRRTRHAIGRPDELVQRHRPAQVDVRVVLPREADAAEGLHAVLAVQERGLERERGRRPRSRRSRRCRPRATARAASHTAARASSVRASMSAQRCFTPWNWPIGRPNCTRTLAYSAAVSTHHCAMPTASAASSTAAISCTRSPS